MDDDGGKQPKDAQEVSHKHVMVQLGTVMRGTAPSLILLIQLSWLGGFGYLPEIVPVSVMGMHISWST